MKGLGAGNVPHGGLGRCTTMCTSCLIGGGRCRRTIPCFGATVGTRGGQHRHAQVGCLLKRVCTRRSRGKLTCRVFKRIVGTGPPCRLRFTTHVHRARMFANNGCRGIVGVLRQVTGDSGGGSLLSRICCTLNGICVDHRSAIGTVGGCRLNIRGDARGNLSGTVYRVGLNSLCFRGHSCIGTRPGFDNTLSNVRGRCGSCRQMSGLSTVLSRLIIRIRTIRLRSDLRALTGVPRSRQLTIVSGVVRRIGGRRRRTGTLTRGRTCLTRRRTGKANVSHPKARANNVALPAASKNSNFCFCGPRTMSRKGTTFRHG